MTKPLEERVTLRAATADDTPFLYGLYKETRKQEPLFSSLSADQADILLKQQYNAMTCGYLAEYPGCSLQIIGVNGDPVGQLRTDISEDRLLLIDISILPDQRNKGTGSHVIGQLIDLARESRRPLRLSVLMDNPAQGLYRRLGFLETETEAPYIKMEWQMGQCPT